MLTQTQITRMRQKVREVDSSVTQMCDALRDPCRFRIAVVLSEVEEACVSDIAEIIDASLPGASRHLKIMEQAGLLDKERMGQTICYSLKKEKQVTELIQAVMLTQVA